MAAATLCLAGSGAGVHAQEAAKRADIRTLTLQECIDMAMELNHSRPASRFAVAAAEAQHRQAMAGYWPHISLKGGYELMDEPHNFVFPSSTFALPPMTIPFPGAGFQLPVTSVTIPDQEIKLQDEESWYASLNAQWLLWDGGMRKGLREQTRAGVEVARQESRRTDLELVDSVKRLYYGAVMAAQVRQVGEDTLARMEATLSLTETMYKEGAGKVKKTDFLDNKVMVETLRSAVALLEKNEAMAQAALAYTIGLAWNDTVEPADDTVPYVPLDADLAALVTDAYAFSPDWKRLEAGTAAAEGAVREAKSGHYPRLAVTGKLHKWWNDYDKGFATPENKEGWTVMVGFKIPIFNGFLTTNRVKEARARLGKIDEERILLREGIGLQVRNIVLGLDAAEMRYQATLDAMESATENRDLNTRAYQSELVETEDVIKSQLMEAFMSVQHYKVCFDHVELRSKLDLVVGTEVARKLGVK
jgi:outer membrane protein TolC